MIPNQKAFAQVCLCPCEIPLDYAATVLHPATNDHITEGFLYLQDWMTNDFFERYILPSYMMWAEHFGVTTAWQVAEFAKMVDARQQAETQRVFQELQAEAHSDYHPSESLCRVGTNMRSAASSQRLADLNAHVIATRQMHRLNQTGDTIALDGRNSDVLSRLEQWRTDYASPNDNTPDGFRPLVGAGGPVDRHNMDVTMPLLDDAALTREYNFTNASAGLTQDEEDVFALGVNFIGHRAPSQVPSAFLAGASGEQLELAQNLVVRRDTLTARRSVLVYSASATWGSLGEGAPESQPYHYAAYQDSTGLDNAEIEQRIGTSPSGRAQADYRTNTMLQDPNYTASLQGETPANISRMNASLLIDQAGQKQQIIKILERIAMNRAVAAAYHLDKRKDRVRNEINALTQRGDSR
ncbi:MAG: hypothetical protein AAF569_09090 [Pseudomonadota bacterium]